MELKLIWDILWRRKWIIIQAFLVISLTIISGSFLFPPVYESISLLQLEKSESESALLANIGLLDNKTTSVGSSDYSMENTIEIATSKPIINTIISNLQLSDGKGNLLKSEDILDSGLFNKIQPKPTIEVNYLDATDMFEIVSTSIDPDEAAMIANTLAEECIANNLKQKKEEYKHTKDFLKNQIQIVKEQYIESLEETKRFSTEQKTLDIGTERKNIINRRTELVKEKEDTVIELAKVQAQINELQIQLNVQNEQTILGVIYNDTYITGLRSTIIDSELKLAEVLVEKKKDHPDVKIIEQQLAKVKSELNHEILLSKQYSTELLNQKTNLAGLKAHLYSLNKEIDNHTLDFTVIPEIIFNDAQMKLKTTIAQEMYKSMLEYLYQIRIAELTVFSDLKIVESATVPEIDKPKSPKKILNGIVGIFLGMVCGVTLGFMVDYLDDTIKTQDDIRRTGVPLLGSVPKIKQKGNLIISGKSPKDPLSEAYRSIRNSIKFAIVDKPIKTLLITSAIANEGKTTTACNLAISMTYEGKKVLLLDGDYRRPTVHKVFGLQNHIGSTSIIAQQADINEAIQESGIEKLSIMSSGSIPPDPAQLIESKKMKELINDLSDRFDIVIIDTPPILVANDAVILAGLVDGFITVTESHKETYAIFNQVKEIYTNAKIKPIGVVLNKFKIGRASNYSYYYYNT